MVQGGAGSAVNEVLAAHGLAQTVINYGLPDSLIQHGSRDEMLESAGMTKQGLLKFIRNHFDGSGHISEVKTA